MRISGVHRIVRGIIIGIFLTLALGSYVTADDEAILQQLQLLQRKYVKARRVYNEEQSRQALAFLELADYTQTIKAYEMFLSINYDTPELQERAIGSIYQLTEDADLIEGYKDFLYKYPSATEAENAGERLHEIAYAIARTEHTIPGYTSFLSNFLAAPPDLQETALLQLISLEEEEIAHKLAEQAPKDEQTRQDSIDRIGRQIYEEAIAAKNSDDTVTFTRKYKAIMLSDFFKGSHVRFDLIRDEELSKKLDEIQQAIERLREDIKQVNALLLEKLTWLQKADLREEKYLQEIVNIIEEQQLKDSMPMHWDLSKSPWENVIEQGTKHLGEWAFPRATKVIKILAEIRAKRLIVLH